MNSRAANRYALALMAIGIEKKSVEVFARDLSVITESLHGSTELRSLLHSPVIRPEIKRNVINELFKTRISADTLTFINLLISKGRSQLIGDAAESFQMLLDTASGTINAAITSAHELDDTAKKQITDRLHEIVKLTIRPTFATDAKLRGGFVAKIGDTFIDASLQHQLENLREEWKSASSLRMN